MGKPKVRGRPRSWWVDNIKMNLRETDWGGMGWTYLAQDKDQSRALVNTDSIKC
jgi:hypothetical protein